MVLASSLSERHPKQSLSSSISGPPVTKTDVLLASARPTQKSGCQQTSWMGLISPWSRFWTRLDPAKPSTHVPKAPQPKPKRTVGRCGRRRHARAAPGARGPIRQLQACDRDAAPRPQPITIGLTQSGRHPTEPTLLPPSGSLPSSRPPAESTLGVVSFASIYPY